MKIAYICMQFPAPSETFASHDVRTLEKLGAEVSVYCMRGPHEKYSSLVLERDLQRIPISHAASNVIFPFFESLFLSPKLFAHLFFQCWKLLYRRPIVLLKSLCLIPRSIEIFHEVLKFKPDMLHLFWGHFPSLVGLLFLKTDPSQKISVFLGAYDLELRYPFSEIVGNAAQSVWTHSKSNLPALEALGIASSKIRVAYRGVDIARLDLPPAEKVNGSIVSGGRLIGSKRFDLVLSVVEKLYHQRASVSLKMFGEGEEKVSLQTLAKKLQLEGVVQFLGHVDQGRVMKELASAQIFLFFSTYGGERLPNIVKEAMLHGCLCFVSRSTGIEELIESGKDGFILDSSDPREISEFICRVLSDELLVRNVRREARKKILENFRVETSVGFMYETWRSSLSQDGKREVVSGG